MDRQGKEQVMEDFRTSLQRSSVAVATHYRGLTVAEMTKLRVRMRQAGAEYQVIKNTLATIAAKDTPFEPLAQLLTGPTGIAFAKDPVAPAKVLTEFAREHPKLIVRGGVLDGKLMDEKGIEALAKLPSREVLLGQLLGVMNGPIRGFVTVLAALPTGLVRALDQIRQQKEEGGASA